jgi:hypothetical protein
MNIQKIKDWLSSPQFEIKERTNKTYGNAPVSVIRLSDGVLFSIHGFNVDGRTKTILEGQTCYIMQFHSDMINVTIFSGGTYDTETKEMAPAIHRTIQINEL